MKNESLMKKNSKRIIWFVIIVCVLDFSYMILNKYYLRPKNWINENFEVCRKKYTDASDSNIMNFCECLYEKFYSRYGDVSEFPKERNYKYEDDYDMVSCYIENILPDSLKERCRKNINNIVKDEEEIRNARLRKEDSISAQQHTHDGAH